jgi:hypothetical protein
MKVGLVRDVMAVTESDKKVQGSEPLRQYFRVVNLVRKILGF